MKTFQLGFCGLLALLPLQYSSAAVVGIDSTITNPALSRPSTLDSEILRFMASGTTNTDLTFFTATFVNNTSQPFNASASTPHPAAGDTLAMLSSKYITQGEANASQLDYAIGDTVAAGDGDIFFMYELNLNAQDGDDVVVRPLSGGSLIGAWSLTINPSDYGPQTALFDISLGLTNVGARGVTFTLADFTGDTGSLTGVDGLRFVDSGGAWDPLAAGRVGTVIVPEPTTFLIWSLGLLGLMGWRRGRRK